MRAWVVHQPGPVAAGPLHLIERPVPEPGPGQMVLRIRCCGVCPTDLHLAQGDLPPKRPDISPGHEVVAEVVAAGPGTRRFAVGDRVGAAWLGEAARELARSLGVASAQDSFDPPPVPLDSAIPFAPVGTLVPPAPSALDGGGTLAIAGIYLTDIPVRNYERHLFQERQVRSVTANNRADETEFLTLAGRLRIKVTITPYRFDQADQALADLAGERVHGAAELSMA